jgi:hypothetical protein
MDMTFKIGFAAEEMSGAAVAEPVVPCEVREPRRSVVQVKFPDRGGTLAYYNDQFDLRCGDLVWVSGKLEGQLGRVVGVSYTFKIKLSDYQRVIAVADTEVRGRFFHAGSHFVTFDPAALPCEQVLSWFCAPDKEDDVIVSGSDGETFSISDLKGMDVTPAIAQRGHGYYLENRVRYISINGTKGFALVEGTEPYTVEFQYRNGEISALTCSCYCAYPCKHQFAAMLQLKETLALVEKQYAAEFERTACFAAIEKSTFFAFAVDGKESGSFTL